MSTKNIEHDYSEAIKILKKREKELLDELEVCSSVHIKELEEEIYEIRDSIRKMSNSQYKIDDIDYSPSVIKYGSE